MIAALLLLLAGLTSCTTFQPSVGGFQIVTTVPLPFGNHEAKESTVEIHEPEVGDDGWLTYRFEPYRFDDRLDVLGETDEYAASVEDEPFPEDPPEVIEAPVSGEPRQVNAEADQTVLYAICIVFLAFTMALGMVGRSLNRRDSP